MSWEYWLCRAGVPATAAEDRSFTHTFEFSKGSGGMLAGFSDYSLSTTGMDLLAEVRRLPGGVSDSGTGRQAYYIESTNRSDDTFMFLKGVLKSEHGVVAGHTYRVSFDIEFASDANNCIGVGGSVDSVFLKAGVSPIEPVTTIINGDYISLNLDKGQQPQGGRDITTIGSIWNGTQCPQVEWRMLHKTYEHPYVVTASNNGELWITVGTESGFEATTGIYFRSIKVKLTEV